MGEFDRVEHWTAADGARLALRRARAQGRHRASLVLLHGFGEHSGRYGHVAGWFAGRGISVFALDLRGHGRSPGPRGHVARFAQFLSDVVALRKLAAAEAPGPQLVLGHSFGGAIALRYLETGPQGLSGAILSSPAVVLAIRIPAWKTTLASWLAGLAPAIGISTGVELAHLSTDPAVGEAVKSDPLCHQVMSPMAYRETVDAQALLLAQRDRITVPLLFLLAGDDRIVSRPAAEAFAVGLPGDVTVRVYEGFFHEVLNERERDRAFADIEPWLDRVLPRPQR
ncbi:MAG: lysophospholipase [Gemmatimonadetes bacterium]|nr:lysophospholipase [Gemmatimonadota bacterium]